jgi:glutathione S-transferase
VSARLYVLPGSHPSVGARLMLEHKGISFQRVDLIPMVAKPILRALGFPGATVPALKLDGRRIQGSREIARALDELRPEPPLFPEDSGRRREVEEAERFGDETLQPVPRRLVWWALRRDSSPLRSFAEGARLGIPLGLAIRTAPPLIWAAARYNGSTDGAVRADLAALPGLLDRVDLWIGKGVVGGEQPNAADFQIATSIRLLLCLDDVRPPIEDRPAGALARRLVPGFPGRVRPIFPRPWLTPLAERVRVSGRVPRVGGSASPA